MNAADALGALTKGDNPVGWLVELTLIVPNNANSLDEATALALEALTALGIQARPRSLIWI